MRASLLVLAACGTSPPAQWADVTAFGALGDGVTDDTAAIQAAVDSVADGGVIVIPDGTYRIQAVGPTGGVQLHSHQTLDIHGTLEVIPNDSPEYGLIRIYMQSDVTVRGGTLVGDRDEHTGVGGEKGHGIGVRSSQSITIEGVTTHDMWGDGIYIGPVAPDGPPSGDVHVSNCVSYNNRRQGLSVTNASDVTITGCSFSGIHGTPPESGVDLEPSYPNHFVHGVTLIDNTFSDSTFGLLIVQQTGSTTDIVATDNVMTGNAMAGIWVVGSPSPVDLEHDLVTGNGAGIWFHAVNGDGASGNTIAHDHIANNAQQGIWLEGASRNTIVANELVGNGGEAGAFDNVLLSADSDANLFDSNTVRSGSRYGVSIATPDCDRNAITHNDLVSAGALAPLLDLGTGTLVDGNSQ